jgi:glutathione peroxidase|tara:strand:- start:150 stop:656 length:507 start_codon:yes stop_codon:yes gene_type:complete
MSLFTFTNSYSQESIYDIDIATIEGVELSLEKFKGKKILFVNVASNCGFTKQYEELESLYQLYKEELVVIGLPCNQFGGQEPGTNLEIIDFCSNNYGISFIMTEKIDVKGKDQHPLYSWLCNKEKNGKTNSKVRWNFQKYLVDEEGKFLQFFYSTTNPMSSKIISYLK